MSSLEPEPEPEAEAAAAGVWELRATCCSNMASSLPLLCSLCPFPVAVENLDEELSCWLWDAGPNMEPTKLKEPSDKGLGLAARFALRTTLAPLEASLLEPPDILLRKALANIWRVDWGWGGRLPWGCAGVGSGGVGFGAGAGALVEAASGFPSVSSAGGLQGPFLKAKALEGSSEGSKSQLSSFSFSFDEISSFFLGLSEELVSCCGCSWSVSPCPNCSWVVDAEEEEEEDVEEVRTGSGLSGGPWLLPVRVGTSVCAGHFSSPADGEPAGFSDADEAA